MPLSAKEKMRAFRERIRQDPVKAEESKKKDRDRKIVKKKKLTHNELKVEREHNRKRVAKHRANKKNSKSPSSVRRRTRGQIQVENLVHIVPFKSPQSLGKAKSKVLPHLPTSPRKRTAVLISIADDVGLPIPQKARTDGSGNSNGNRIDGDTEKKVEDFYLTTSWMCPGQKDSHIIRAPGKEKQKVQKQFMLTTLKEAHSMFLDANPNVSISFSKFCALRPPQVHLQAEVPHNSCLCKYHENVRLILQSLSKAGQQLPTDFRSFIALLVCDQNSENCMTGTCDKCPGLEVLAPSDDNASQHISWQQWDEKANRNSVSGTVQMCFNELKEKVPSFLLHTYVKRIQADEFRRQRESVNENENKVVIQVDFAENYTSKFQDEIQSAYWSYTQTSLFTVCAWEKEGVHSMVFASDYLHHDKYAVHTFLGKIFEWLDEVRQFKEIVIFSDGAASQFKQKYLLCSLTLLDRPIIWNFFATSHGKGPVDGIGGTCKRVVAKEALSGRVDVKTSQQFADVASMKCPGINVFHVSKEEIQKTIPNINKDLEGIIAIPNTKKIHMVSMAAPYSVDIQSHAKAVTSTTHNFRKDNGERVNDNSQDNLNNENEDFTESDDDQHNHGSDSSIVETQSKISCVDEDADLDSKWVSVPLSSEKYAKQFVGQVISSSDGALTVKFLKQVGLNKYVWPAVDDIEIVKRCNISKILNEPQMDRRDGITFV